MDCKFKLHILIPVWETLTFIQGHTHEKLTFDVDEVWSAATACWLVGADINLFRAISIQWENSTWDDFFLKYTYNIRLRSKAYEPVSFKLDIMMDMT